MSLGQIFTPSSSSYTTGKLTSIRDPSLPSSKQPKCYESADSRNNTEKTETRYDHHQPKPSSTKTKRFPFQLAQVQSLVRSQQPNPISNHHPFTDKLVEDSLFTSPSPPPHGATVNQLLRRAAMQHRRDRRISSDPENEHKRIRAEHIMSNNNNNELNLSHQPPPQTQPADFSPSAMKNMNSLVNSTLKNDIEGNGISSTEREGSPCSTSPSQNSRINNDEGNVKSEPMELLCSTNQDDNSNDSTDLPTDNGPSKLTQGPHSGSSGGDHDDHDSPIGPYLTPTESKLFATAAGSFNFSMAALAADPTGLGG